MNYRVNVPFRAFGREYKARAVLDDDALSCWQPDEQRDIELAALLRRGHIDLIEISDPAGAYPATWGTAPALPEAEMSSDQPE